MKINIIGVVSAMIALVSLAMPWWTITITASTIFGEMPFSWDMYTWGLRSPAEEGEAPIVFEFAEWYRYAALAFVIAGAIFGLAGSITVGRKGRTALALSGMLTILAAIIFVAGLATDAELTEASPIIGPIGIFENRKIEYTEVPLPLSYSLSAYLHIGFFLAVIAAVLAFISVLKHPPASS